jgi:hypothetical protein
MMFQRVHDRTATGVARVILTATVLPCGKQMENNLIISIISIQNRGKCEILPLETRQPGSKLLPPSDLQESVFEGSQKQPEKVQYLNYFGRTITNDARFTLEFKSRIVIGKAAIIKK